MKEVRRSGRLPPWQEWSVYATFTLLAVTGIAWLLLDSFVRVAGEFGAEHHPTEHIALIVHGVASYAFLIIGGAMIPVHIATGWDARRNVKSGFIFVATLLLLAATALGLYYLGDDILRARVSNIHWLAGLLALPLLVIHVLRGRRAVFVSIEQAAANSTGVRSRKST